MQKVFAFRFDIDTPKCLGQGVPPLLELGERLGAPFTFFLNVGRSVSLLNFLRMKLQPKAVETAPAAAFSALQKLGPASYVYTALCNPRIAPKFSEIVRRIPRFHELGIHGGHNHDLWHHHVNSWTPEKTIAEVRWSLDWLRRHDLAVDGFSSPGWSERADLAQILCELGFKYRADRHGPSATGVQRENGILNVGTNLTGEPGGVAYLENQRALGRSDNEVMKDFESRLAESPHYAVVYDHPYFAGLRELDMIEKMVQRARELGFEVVTLGEIARRGCAA